MFISLFAAIEIVSGSLTATLAEGDGKGRLLSLVDATGRNYVSARNDEFQLWQVEACRTDSRAKTSLTDAKAAKVFRVEKAGGETTLVWEDAGETVARAVATFRTEPSDGSIRCRLAVTPKPGWALVETQFPRFGMNECLGSTPTDDAIVMGTGHGGLVRYPMNPRREYWRSRHIGHSPGNLVAQFGSFFDDAGGLYTMAEDAAGNEKELLMDRWWRSTLPDGSYGGGAFLFRWSRFEYSETTDEQPYDIVLRGFRGADGAPTTWYDAADLYKAWAERQFWCAKKFLEKTDFLAPWTRETPVVMEFNRDWFDNPAKLRWWLENYWQKKFPGAPFLAILIGWERHGDWITTEYFPPHPNEERFAEMTGWIKAAGGHPWPWPGGHHWNVQVGKKADGTYRLDFSKDFWSRVAPHAVKDPDGKVHLDNLVWLGGGNSASICSDDPWGVDWWNKDISAALVRRGADLVQADQDVGARIPTCWATDHGHKPGPGKWRMASQRRQFETMLAEMRKTNPWAMFSFEEMHEYFNDIYAFCDYRNCRWPGPEWASVWNYLYHEYVVPFQSGSEQFGRWFWTVFCAVDGQMPRLPIQPRWYSTGGVLFENGDFETAASAEGGFANWERPETHVEAPEAFEGRHALQVGGDKAPRVQVARNLPVETMRPGTVYRVTATLKTVKAHRGSGVHFSALDQVGGKYRGLGGVSFDLPKVGEGWKTCVKEFTMPKGCTLFRIMFDAYKGGVYLVDGVKFEERLPDGTWRIARECADGQSEMLAFTEKWIRLYRGEGRRFLAHGKALRPPRVECDVVPYEENFRGAQIVNDKPAVFASAWEAADGARAVCLGNATPVDRKVSYCWRGEWTTLVLKPRELRLVHVK